MLSNSLNHFKESYFLAALEIPRISSNIKHEGKADKRLDQRGNEVKYGKNNRHRYTGF